MHDRLLIVIPAWNEEVGLAFVLAEVATSFPDADVLVVDDGSTDATADVASAGGATVISFPENRGLGVGIAKGFSWGVEHGYGTIARLDADGQHPASELHVLVDRVRSGVCDLAVGSRFVSDHTHDAGRYRLSLWRGAATGVVRLLIRGAVGRRVADPLSGMCAFNFRTAKLLSAPFVGNAPEIEILIRADRAGLRVDEVAVDMRERRGGQSKITGRRLITVLPTMRMLAVARLTRPFTRRRTQPSRPGLLTRRAASISLLVATPLSAGCIFLASRGLDVEELRRLLETADWPRVAVASAAIGGVLLFQAIRWKRVSRPIGVVPLRWSFARLTTSVAVNNVLPGRPGELLRSVRLAQRLGAPQGRALSTVVVDRSADVVVLVAALICIYPTLPHDAWVTHALEAASVLVAAVLALFVAAYVAARISRPQAYPRAAARIPRRIREQASAFAAGVVSLNAADVGVILALTAVAWLSWAASAWFVASAIGLHLSLVEVLFITVAINLGAALPSTPGFIGTFQWLSVSSLGLYGVPRTEAFAFSVLMHATWYLPTTIAGASIAFYGWLRSRLRRPRIDPHAVPSDPPQLVEPVRG